MGIFFPFGVFGSKGDIGAWIDVILKFAVKIFGAVIGIFPVSVGFAFAGLNMEVEVIVGIAGTGEKLLITVASPFNGVKIIVVVRPFFGRNDDGT